GECIVGHHPLEPNAVLGEEAGRAAQAGGTGSAALVVECLAVSKPRVIVHQRVDVVVAEAPLHARSAQAAMNPVPTPRRNPAQFLDVEMAQLAGLRVFIAADHAAGWAIQPGEPLQPVPAEDR